MLHSPEGVCTGQEGLNIQLLPYPLVERPRRAVRPVRIRPSKPVQVPSARCSVMAASPPDLDPLPSTAVDNHDRNPDVGVECGPARPPGCSANWPDLVPSWQIRRRSTIAPWPSRVVGARGAVPYRSCSEPLEANVVDGGEQLGVAEQAIGSVLVRRELQVTLRRPAASRPRASRR
jgi:hypothetical protein